MGLFKCITQHGNNKKNQTSKLVHTKHRIKKVIHSHGSFHALLFYNSESKGI